MLYAGFKRGLLKTKNTLNRFKKPTYLKCFKVAASNAGLCRLRMVWRLTPSHICLEFCHIEKQSEPHWPALGREIICFLEVRGKVMFALKFLLYLYRENRTRDNVSLGFDALVLSSPSTHTRERLSWIPSSNAERQEHHPEYTVQRAPLWGVCPNIMSTTDHVTTPVLSPLRPQFSHFYNKRTQPGLLQLKILQFYNWALVCIL